MRLRGRVWDSETGSPLAATVNVTAASGEFCAPDDALRKVGPGSPFFYANGTFEVQVPRSQVDIVVERGSEYRRALLTLDATSNGAVDVDVPIDRWVRTAEAGWYAGNTHVHYDETETRAAERLQLDPAVEDLSVLVVSHVQRGDIPYASNAFPIGRYSPGRDVIDIGQESRHNASPWEIGLGHIVLINLKHRVEPLSRGVLVDDAAPDYPPLIDACDAARSQGGLVLWCHNGQGIEAPVAAVLGRLDAFNVFDPHWIQPEYEIWYRLLDCGLHLPLSTGSDWFVCSRNRVYAEVADRFTYDSWLQGMRDGRTLATNGPIIRLSVADHSPSNQPMDIGALRSLPVVVDWATDIPIDRIELIADGEVVWTEDVRRDTPTGTATIDLQVRDVAWVAARGAGRTRDSFGHPQWAHTSPVYLRSHPVPERSRRASDYFIGRIDEARGWIERQARFGTADQRSRMLELFHEAYEIFAASCASQSPTRRK